MRTTWPILATVSALLALSTTAVTAQSFAVDHGAWLVGGSAAYSSSRMDSDTTRVTYIYISPELGYFVSRGLLVGAIIPFSHSSATGYRITTYGVGPRVSYFFSSGPRRFYPFLTATAMLQWTRETWVSQLDPTGIEVRDTGRTQSYEVSAGVAAMLTGDVALTGEGYLGSYHYSTQQAGSEASTSAGNAFGVRFGLSVFLH